MFIEIIAVYFKNFPTEKVTLIYKYGLCSWHHFTYNTNGSVTVQVIFLKVGITITRTALALMQYRLLTLKLASLYLQQHQL
jgi:hypothetical protein